MQRFEPELCVFLAQECDGQIKLHASIIYGISLLAFGESSAITGTYAGQYIMQGFLDIKLRIWLRNLVTRCIAICPGLIVAIIGGTAGSGRLIITASMILSFELPFALIPLLKFSSSSTSTSTKMGPHKNSIYIIVVSWVLGLGVIGINVYYLDTSFVTWIIHSSFPKPVTVLMGVVVFPAMAFYVVSLIYLMFSKDMVVAFDEKLEASMEQGGHEVSGCAEAVPCRPEEWKVEEGSVLGNKARDFPSARDYLRDEQP